MFEAAGAGALMGLEAVTVPAATATGPCTIASGPQQYCSRKSTFMQPTHLPAAMSAASTSCASPTASRPASTSLSDTCWQRQSQQHPQHLNDAPASPRRNDLAVAPASPRSRRTRGCAHIRPVPLNIILPTSSYDLDDANMDDAFGDDADLPLHPLPSMVPDERLLVRQLSSSAHPRKPLGSAQAYLEQPLSGTAMGLPRDQDPQSDSASPSGSSISAVRSRDMLLLPSTPGSSHGRRLRAASVIAPQAQAPLHHPHCGGLGLGSEGGGTATVGTATILAGPESHRKLSYKTQMRQLRVAANGCLGSDKDDDDADDKEADERTARAMQQNQSRVSMDEMFPTRRGGTQAWAAVGESAPGRLGPGSTSSCRPGGAPSTGAKPCSMIGFSRQPEDLPAAPYPAHARSLAGGSAGSTPGTASSHGMGSVGGVSRPSIAWQPRNSSSTGSGSPGSLSIGFSRRLEDLPAAPSPSSSRSLRGPVHSGASTPASPGGGSGNGSVLAVQGLVQQPLTVAPPPLPSQQQQQQQHLKPLLPIGGSASGPQALRPVITASVASASGSEEVMALQPHLAPAGMTTNTTSSSQSIRAIGAICPSGFSNHPVPAGATPALAPKPPLQRNASIGFSRRIEDLPAAPSPSNSRSLAKGAGSSASSTLSWCSPRTPPSPAASDTTGRLSLTRRPENLPAAPLPSQSRSLRPESSRAVFRSHASGVQAGPAAAGMGDPSAASPAPSSPLSQSVAISTRGGGNGDGCGGLLASLGSPSPLPLHLQLKTSSSGAQQPQQQRAPLRDMDDVTELHVLQGHMLEE